MGVRTWSLSDGYRLGPSHFIQDLCQTFGKDLQQGEMNTLSVLPRTWDTTGHDDVELRELSINKHSHKNGQVLL